MNKRTITAMVLALLVPGLGHFYLGRRGRAVTFFAIVILLFVIGLSIDGRLYTVQEGNVLSLLATIGSMGAGLPYFNPHSFRATLVRLGEEVCKSPEEFKAWSQNLGHEKVLTTFTSYGTVACQRQGEIMRDLATGQRSVQSDAHEIAEALFRKFRDSGMEIQLK